MAKTKVNDPGANFGFEAKLWAASDALRNNMDAADNLLALLRDTLLPKLISGDLRVNRETYLSRETL